MNSLKTTDNQLIKTNTLILGVFLFFFFTKLLYWLPRDLFGNGINLWVYTDWLIDYSSGFTRRGLSGEIIELTSALAHPRVIIGILVWSIFGTIVFGYIRLLARSLKTLSPFLLMAMLFLPSLLPFYLYDHAAFGRKETIGFLILLWHLYCLEIDNNTQTKGFKKVLSLNNYIKKLLIITAILLPIHVFIHEASFLLFVPVHVIITYTIIRFDPSVNLRRRIIYLTFVYLPVLFAFAIVFIFGQPSFEVALAICKKWELAKALEAGSCNISGKDIMWALPGSITALPWSFSQAASLTLSFSVKTILSWIIIFSTMGLSTVYIGIMIAPSIVNKHFKGASDTTLTRQYSKIMCYKYFLLPLLISAPLYIMGWDIGRWFAVSCINYAMIMLSSEINYAEIRSGSYPETKIEILAKDPIFEQDILLYYIKLFFLLLIVFFIRLPHCCNNGYNMLAEPVKSLAMRIISFL